MKSASNLRENVEARASPRLGTYLALATSSTSTHLRNAMRFGFPLQSFLVDSGRSFNERYVLLYLGSNEMCLVAPMKLDNNFPNLAHDRYIDTQSIKNFIISSCMY